MPRPHLRRRLARPDAAESPAARRRVQHDNVLVFALDARDTVFPAERFVALCGDVLGRVRGRPEVVSASCSTMSPIDTAMEGRVLGIPTAAWWCPRRQRRARQHRHTRLLPDVRHPVGSRAPVHGAGHGHVTACRDRQRNRRAQLLRRRRSRWPHHRLGQHARSAPDADRRGRRPRRTAIPERYAAADGLSATRSDSRASAQSHRCRPDRWRSRASLPEWCAATCARSAAMSS